MNRTQQIIQFFYTIICKRNGETYFENQEDFKKRLLEETKANNLLEAYRKQNKKIGYKLT